MSTRSTLFLTNDNEHWYDDCNCPHYDEKGKFIGYTLTCEISKKNIQNFHEDETDIWFEVEPGSHLYYALMRTKEPYAPSAIHFIREDLRIPNTFNKDYENDTITIKDAAAILQRYIDKHVKYEYDPMGYNTERNF